MTLYNKLKQMLEHGLYPVTVDEDGYYRIYSSVRTDGQLRFGDGDSIEEASSRLGSDFEDKDYINTSSTLTNQKFHSFYHPTIKPYEVGQKVRILERAGESGEYENWPYRLKQMVGGMGTIKAVYDTPMSLHYSVWNSNRSSWDWFRHEYLAPVFEDEGDLPSNLSDDELIKELERRGKIKSGKIIE